VNLDAEEPYNESLDFEIPLSANYWLLSKAKLEWNVNSYSSYPRPPRLRCLRFRRPHCRRHLPQRRRRGLSHSLGNGGNQVHPAQTIQDPRATSRETLCPCHRREPTDDFRRHQLHCPQFRLLSRPASSNLAPPPILFVSGSPPRSDPAKIVFLRPSQKSETI